MAGLATVFGSGAMTNSIPEIENNDVLFVIGSNTTETHPIIGLRMKKAVRKGAKLIVADPRRINLVRFADVWLQQKPGTDVVLLNAAAALWVGDAAADLEAGLELARRSIDQGAARAKPEALVKASQA